MLIILLLVPISILLLLCINCACQKRVPAGVAQRADAPPARSHWYRADRSGQMRRNQASGLNFATEPQAHVHKDASDQPDAEIKKEPVDQSTPPTDTDASAPLTAQPTTVAPPQDEQIKGAQQRQNELNATIRQLTEREDTLRQTISKLEDDIAPERQVKIAEMEAAVAEQKKAALAKVEAWIEEEKTRLSALLVNQQRDQSDEIRKEKAHLIYQEFEQIHQFFDDIAKSQKAGIQSDINDFLKQRRAAIIDEMD